MRRCDGATVRGAAERRWPVTFESLTGCNRTHLFEVILAPYHSLAPSHPRTLAPSHPRTLAPSHLRTFAPSHPRTFAPSHPRTLAPSHLRTLAPSHPRTLAPSHPRTFAPSHPRTLAPSHPRTLAPSPRCILSPMSQRIRLQISTISSERTELSPPEAFRAQANVRDEGVYERADRDPEGFWAGFASELEWFTPWTQVLDWKRPTRSGSSAGR